MEVFMSEKDIDSIFREIKCTKKTWKKRELIDKEEFLSVMYDRLSNLKNLISISLDEYQTLWKGELNEYPTLGELLNSNFSINPELLKKSDMMLNWMGNYLNILSDCKSISANGEDYIYLKIPLPIPPELEDKVKGSVYAYIPKEKYKEFKKKIEESQYLSLYV
jgi:hypothetical protein